MQGIVQLPDYLERLQSGHRDIPIVLLPLLNQLRESRGEKGLNESVLFSPDLSRPLPASAHGPQMPLDPPGTEPSRRRRCAACSRARCCAGSRTTTAPPPSRDLTDVCEQLVPITCGRAGAAPVLGRRAALLDALGKGAFPIQQAAQAGARQGRARDQAPGRRRRRRVPHRPADRADQATAVSSSRTKAPTPAASARSARCSASAAAAPSEAELAHARGSLTGNNRALLETVAVAIKEDLLRVKDALDLHLRTPGASLGGPERAGRKRSTASPTRSACSAWACRAASCRTSARAINDVISGQRKDNEATLLDIAGALLYVEAALDDQVERLGREDAERPADSAAAVAARAPSRAASARSAGQGSDRQLRRRRGRASSPSSRRTGTTRSSRKCRACSMKSPARCASSTCRKPADYLIGIRQFTDNELLRRKQVPNGQQMDRLADALASLEYFLEALRDRRPNRDQILEVARQSLESLGYWPLPAENRARRDAGRRCRASGAGARRRPRSRAAPSEPRARRRQPSRRVRAGVGRRTAHPHRRAAPSPSPPQPVAAPVAARRVLRRHGRRARARLRRREQRRNRRRDPRSLPRGVRGRNRQPGAAAAALARRPGQRRTAAADPSRVPHAEGQRPPGRRARRSASSAGRSRACSTACSTAAVRPARQVLAMVQLALRHLPLLRAALQGEEVYADLAGIAGHGRAPRRRRGSQLSPPRRLDVAAPAERSRSRRAEPKQADRRPETGRSDRPSRSRSRAEGAVVLDRPGAAGNPQAGSRRPPGNRGCLAGGLRRARPAAGHRSAAALDPHDERRLRDDRARRHHRRHRAARRLRQALARAQPRSGRRGRARGR